MEACYHKHKKNLIQTNLHHAGEKQIHKQVADT